MTFKQFITEDSLRHLPQFLYHIADRSTLRSIQKHGLRAERDYILSGEHWDKPGVNLVSKHKYPFPFRPERSFKVKVDTSKLDLSKLTRWSWWYRYWDAIPPELLTFEL